MGLNTAIVRTLFRSELRQFLRDRRTLLLSIILPILVMPIMFFAARTMEARQQKRLLNTRFLYAVSGDRAAEAREIVALGLSARARQAGPALLVEEIPSKNPEADLQARKIHVHLESISVEEEARQAAEKKRLAETGPSSGNSRPAPQAKEPTPEERHLPLIRVKFKSNEEESREGGSHIQDLLNLARGARRDALLAEKGFPLPPSQVVVVEAVDVARPEQVSGAWLGRFLVLMVAFLVLTGGSVVAIDTVAGEKERGTLETLLATGAGRIEIVTAKQLLVLAVGIAITALQVVNLLVYAGFGLIPLPEAFKVTITVPGAVFLLLLLVPVAAVFSSALLWVSAIAKSYKEAQLYMTPLILGGLVPGLAGMMPGIRLRSAMVVVPVANAAIGCKEVLAGIFDVPFLLIATAVNLAAAYWVARAGARALTSERLIVGSEIPLPETGAGAELFRRNVLRWFLLIWVVMFAVATNVPALSGFRSQILFNIGLLFLGGSLLMLWRYRLNWRETLSLRAPHPVAWMAVLVGAPAGMLAAVGVFKLADLVLPVPQKMLEAVGQGLFPEEIPLWQMVFFLCLMPGFGEEVAFRGLLLHGLSRRFKPLTLCLVVGLIFGLFHVVLFRIIPTAFLGVMLSAVVVLTGSIFPAMVWHALNNGMGLLAQKAGMNPADLGASWYIGAGVVLMLSFYLLWRTRKVPARSPAPAIRA